MTRTTRSKLKPFVLAALVALTGAFAAGCSDDNGEALKKTVLDSLNKQADMKSHSFSGTADLNIGALPQSADANPVASSLLSMFQNSKLEWNGAATTEPVRLEATVKSTQAGSANALELPLLLKDNKLYVNLPLINKKDEFFQIDLAQLSAMSGQNNALSAESFKQATQTASGIGSVLISDLKPKWFAEDKEPAAFQDGAKGTLIRIDITDKNKKEVTDAMRAKLPEMIDKLAAGGFVAKGQADKLKEDAKTISVETPGKLTFAIDEQGFAREQQIEIAYTQAGKDGLPVKRHLNLHLKAEGINKEPKFVKEVPTQVKPFEDVLRLLFGAGKAPQK
ncbi:hypothetical protein [Paenibacillus sp. MBLB4367]|uniref:hypothetical protein n=1 Tax=Paenibacillus sp. MBLB4367 TaxID=3384767 RepID=UPI00390800AF